MSSTSGPLTGTCPDHGEQPIVCMGAFTVTFACGAVGNGEDGYTHKES